jgi:hypothetical protein
VLLVGQRPLEDAPDLGWPERLEPEDPQARPQGSDDVEVRVLAGHADQGDQALLDVGEERRLLGA